MDYNSINIPSLIEKLLKRNINESSIQVVDYGLCGLIEIIRLLLIGSKNMDQIKNPLELNKEILDALFLTDHIFPKCKSEKSRIEALKFLELLISKFPEVSTATFKFLFNLHTTGNWRTNKKLDWNIQGGQGSKSGNYVGLKNLGATCYFNSTLQQIYMIPQIRRVILELDHKNLSNEENMLYQLQLTYSFLKESQRSSYNPKSLTQTFKMEGRVLDIGEQKDVDEFLTHLLDQLEQEIKGTTQSRLLKDTIKLKLANEIICKDCPHKSETNEEAISIILSVKNKKTIYESLNAYVQSDTLEGENAYYCERCDRKVAAYKRQNIKSLPNILLIVLKRFEFNLETLAKVKVNDYCEFPHELDMKDFTQEGQAYKELTKEIESGKLSQEDLTEEQKKLLQKKIPKEYYSYKLKGITIHKGNVDGGHYYSFIMDRENEDIPENKRWFEFNDTIVSPFDPKDIPEEAFGGVESDGYYINGKKEQPREKIHNAYVLIYERVVQINGEKFELLKQEERELDAIEIEKKYAALIQEKIPKLTSEIHIPVNMQRIINQDNKKHWLTQYIFQPNYLNFVVNVVKSLKIPEDNNYALARESIDSATKGDSPIDGIHFIVVMLLTSALRAENKQDIPKLLNFVKDCCRKNVKICMWLCKLFCQKENIQEFLGECPVPHVRRWVAGLINVVLQQLYSFERLSISKLISNDKILYDPQLFIKATSLPADTPLSKNKFVIQKEKHQIPYCVMLINSFMQQIWLVKDFYAGQLYQVFCFYAKLGPEARIHLNMCSMLGVSIEIIRNAKGNCSKKIEESLVLLDIKDDMSIGVMVNEHVYISKKQQEKRSIQHQFLFELIYLLLGNAELKAYNLVKNKGPTYKLCEDEEKYLVELKENKYLDFLIADCEFSKVSINYLAKTLAFIAFDNEGFIAILIKYVLKKFAEEECNKLRLYFRITYFLLSNVDSYVNKPENILPSFNDLFKKNAGIYRISEKFIDFWIKMSRNLEFFLLSLKEKRIEQGQMLDIMDKWLKDNPYPSIQFHVYFIICLALIGKHL